MQVSFNHGELEVHPALCSLRFRDRSMLLIVIGFMLQSASGSDVDDHLSWQAFRDQLKTGPRFRAHCGCLLTNTVCRTTGWRSSLCPPCSQIDCRWLWRNEGPDRLCSNWIPCYASRFPFFWRLPVSQVYPKLFHFQYFKECVSKIGVRKSPPPPAENFQIPIFGFSDKRHLIFEQ